MFRVARNSTSSPCCRPVMGIISHLCVQVGKRHCDRHGTGWKIRAHGFCNSSGNFAKTRRGGSRLTFVGFYADGQWSRDGVGCPVVA